MDFGTANIRKVFALVCCSILVVNADYHVGFNGPTEFNNPNNQLSNGECCHTNCTEQCNTALRYCFRDANHSHSDTSISESSCFYYLERSNPTSFPVVAQDTAPIMACYMDSFQIFIRVSHQIGDSPDFSPSSADPLIDDIFIEVTDHPPTLYEFRRSAESIVFTATGDFDRVTLELRVTVLCAMGYNGSDCNTLCQDENEGAISCGPMYDCSATSSPDSSTSTTTFMIPSEVPVVTNPNNDNSNVVAIAVGATIGGILVLVVVLVIVGVFVICFKSSKNSGSYKPSAHIHYPVASNRDSRPFSVTESQLTSRPREHSFSSESASISSPGNVPVADMYTSVNKTLTGTTINRGPYVPPYVPTTREYQAFNQTRDINSNKDPHVYQNTLLLREHKDYTDSETENTLIPKEYDQGGLVYADLDISRQKGTMTGRHESQMEEWQNGVETSDHSSKIMEEDNNDEPYDNIEVTYTTVQH